MNDRIKKLAEEALAKHKEQKEKIQTVRDRFPGVRWPDVYSRPASYRDGNNIIDIADRVAIVGNTVHDVYDAETQTNREEPFTAFYNFASQQYKIETHEEALMKLEAVMVNVPEYGKPTFKPRVFMDGARMVVDVLFPEVNFEVGPRKEQLNPKAELRNSYDLSWEFQLRFGAHQKVCTNGMYAFKQLQKISKKHRRNLDAEAVVSEITDYMGKFSEQVGWWDKWANLLLNSDQVGDVMTALDFTEKRADEIKALPLIGRGAESLNVLKTPSLWDVNSAITQFLTHNVESDMVRIELGERVPTVLDQYYRAAA